MDEDIKRYKKKHPCSERMLMAFSVVFSIQIFRLLYAKSVMKEAHFKRVNRYSIVQVTIVFMPIITSALYNLVWTNSYRQVFYTDIEVAIFTFIIMIMVIADVCHSERRLDPHKIRKDPDEDKLKGKRYKLDSSHNTTNLMDLTPRDILLASVGKTEGHNLSQAVVERLLARFISNNETFNKKHKMLENVQ